MSVRFTGQLPRILLAAAVSAALLLTSGPAFADLASLSSAERAEVEANARLMKQSQVAKLRDHFKRERAEQIERVKELRRHRKRIAKTGSLAGVRWKPESESREAGAESRAAILDRVAQRLASGTPVELNATPANVRANNPALEGIDVCQSEESIASFGDYVLVAWNDGNNDITQAQGYGYSVDGGATFVDGGSPPQPAGGSIWISDPVVTVNEKTGEFWFCSLLLSSATGNEIVGIGVVKATFSGSSITWGTPVITRLVDGVSKSFDKQWMVADSTSGNLYLTCTLFTTTDDSIQVQRSTDGGLTWSGPITVSDPSTAGLNQGSRPSVGPNGEVYVTWYEIGLVDADLLKIAVSNNQGVSYGAPQTVANFFTNYDCGAPGFNRAQGISFPSIAVDRTNGPHRGRLYVTYNESLNFYDDPIGSSGAKSSVENDNFFARANQFTIGNKLRGTLTSTTNDLDYFKFNAVAGTSYIFFCDSIPRPLYTMRVFCGQDTFTRLAYSGDTNLPAGGTSLIIWTAPTTGVYYLRMAYVAVTGGLSGNYRIQTGIAGHGAEIGRDQRDIMVAASDDGATWAAPVRVNDEAALYDDWLPEVAVGADGYPYITWFDWRDDGCGGKSHQYASRSRNGGGTWAANQRFTDVQSAWTSVLSNLQPNQGDYSQNYADARFVRSSWADGRDGDPNVYTSKVDTWHTFTTCTDDTSVTVSTGNPATVSLAWAAQNNNVLFANDYAWSVTASRGWPLPAGGTTNAVAALGAFGGQFLVGVPDTAASGAVQLCARLTNAEGLLLQTCCMNVNVTGSTVGVEDGGPSLSFALHQSTPNPAIGRAKIGFSLPRAGDVKLRIYGLRGELVRTLADGAFAPGTHSLAWDGRDDRGRPVATGTYFYRLEALGLSAVKRMVFIR